MHLGQWGRCALLFAATLAACASPKVGEFRSAPYRFSPSRPGISRRVLSYCIGETPESTVLGALVPKDPPGNAIQVRDLELGTGMHCALSRESSVLCWGSMGFDERSVAYSGEAPKSGHSTCLQDVESIATGYGHACAVLSDRSVRCWGDNKMAQLGVPAGGGGLGVFRPEITDVQKVVLGTGHTCALDRQGSVYCWGLQSRGILGDTPAEDACQGDNENKCRAKPMAIPGIRDAMDIVAGNMHTCVRTRGGRVLCWGNNYYGFLGNHGTKDSARPVEVEEAKGATALAAGTQHTCALLPSRRVLCWGGNGSMQLGRETQRMCSLFMVIGDPHSCDPWPDFVPDLEGVRAIDAEGLSTCALRVDGTVWCWGVVQGDEEPPYGWANSVPSAIEGVHDATAIRVGHAQICVERGEQGWYCFGREFTPPELNRGPRPSSVFGSKLLVEKQP